jgi:hypothetical protein
MDIIGINNGKVLILLFKSSSHFLTNALKNIIKDPVEQTTCNKSCWIILNTMPKIQEIQDSNIYKL